MKKKKVLLIILIFLIVICLICCTSNNKKLITNDGVLAITIDGYSSSTFPNFSEKKYTVSIDCQNAVGEWKYVLNEANNMREWQLVLKNITNNITCNLDFITRTDEDLLTNVVTNETNNIYKSNAGTRYQGTNPNNYVWFNDELWRIIGYVPTKDVQSEDVMLIKIIRELPIGTLIYDKDSNDYADSDIYNLLNNYYYNQISASKTEYCYTKSDIKAVCDYDVIGIDKYYRNFIKPTQWAIGLAETNTTIKNHYEAELSEFTDVPSGINVGLISPSDYGYAFNNATNELEKTISSLGNDNNINNWILYGQERLISKSSDNYTWTIGPTGSLGDESKITTGYIVRPAVYLDPAIYVVSGTGTASNPYVLDM